MNERTLLPEHRAMLEASGLTEAVIESRGYFSAVTKTAVRALGMAQSQALVPALVIPIYGPDGDVPTLHQTRPNAPRSMARPNKPPRSIKYETPAGASMVLDVPPLCRPCLGDPSVPLWITEGVKKADCAVGRGLVCVALLGVSNFKGRNAEGGKVELSEWDRIAFNGRDFFVAFDSDAIDNPDVFAAMKRLGAMIHRRGGRARYVIIPSRDGRKVGLDDFLAGGGTVEELRLCARADLPAGPAKKTSGSTFYDRTDLGNAERFVALHGAEIRYCEKAGGWFFWDGMRWAPDLKSRVKNLLIAVTKDLRTDAMAEDDPDARKDALRWCDRSQSASGLRDTISIASGLPGVAVTVDEFDQNVYLLNTRTGIVDTRNGSVSPHDSALLITKFIDIEYRDDAECPRFLEFLGQIMPDPEVQEFLWRFAGYCLTADTREQCFVFLHGGGQNGKSSLVWLLNNVLGSYAKTMEMETLMDMKGGMDAGKLSTLAELMGSRMVLASEPEEGAWLNEKIIKRLTGGESIRAKFMHSNTFEFEPTFKILISSNPKPRVKGTDHAIWRRIRLVPFEQRFDGAREVKNLKESILADEAAGILRWMVLGCTRWFKDGLTKPAAVVMATDDLRQENDLVGQFLEQRTQPNPMGSIRMSRLYAAYKAWCDSNGFHATTSAVLGKRLKTIWEEKGLTRTEDPSSKEKTFHGYELAEPGYSDPHGGLD